MPQLPKSTEFIPLPTDDSLHVTGLVARSLQLTITELRAIFPAHMEHASFINSDENRTIQAAFTGALLWDVLNSAGVQSDPGVKDDLLRFYVAVTACDGYQTVLSWGEIAPDFGESPVLLAYAQDGVLLDHVRLIVPGDKRGGRNVQ